MGFLVVYGWGKKGKKIGYIGIDKCPNCKNYTHLYLYEYANNVNLYFVPIVKWNKKIYVVCPICDSGYELNEEMKKYFIELSLNTLDYKTTDFIWKETNRIVEEYMKEQKEYSEDWPNHILETCKKEIKVMDKDYVVRVVLKFLKSLAEDLTSK